MASKWTEEEEIILKDNFSTAQWGEFLEMLPDKTEDQIIKKAYKLGIKRAKEILDIYYDEDRNAWVEKSVNYNGLKFTHELVFPAPKGMTYEEVRDLLGKKASKVFNEMIVLPRYKEFLLDMRIDHSEELYSIFFDMEKEMFNKNDKDERLKIFDKYRDSLLNAAMNTIEKKKEKQKEKENKKKGR